MQCVANMADRGDVEMRIRGLMIGASIALFASTAPAQIQRYDLGLRLLKMDLAWDAATPENRAKAIPPLKKTDALLLTGKAVEAAASLDEARFALAGIVEPSPAQRWANALIIRPRTRLVDPAGGPLAIQILTCYDVTPPIPIQARVVFSVMGACALG